MSLSTLAKYIRLNFAMTKLSILSAMEYSGAFWMQVIGMFINDFAILLLWYVMFLSFPTINGWQFQDMITLFGLATCNFAFMMILFGGVNNVAKTITMGELDYYLALPKPVLWHLLSSRTDIAAIGDLFFGLMLFFVFGAQTFVQGIAFLSMVILSGAIMLNILIILHSLAFYFTAFEEVVYQYFGIMLGFAFMPQSVFTGGFIRLIMLTIFPAYFVVSLPASMIQLWNWQSFALLCGFWLTTFVLALSIFHRGLRRYESGNLISIRT